MSDITQRQQIMELTRNVQSITTSLARVETDIQYIKKELTCGFSEIKANQQRADNRLDVLEKREASQGWFDALGKDMIKYIITAVLIAVLILIGLK